MDEQKGMILLIRHGQTVENASRIVQGQLPGELSQEGIDEVRRLALRLKDFRLDAVYSSDLQRALLTAGIIMEHLEGTKLVTDPRLREQCLGIYEGKSTFRLLKRMKTEGVDISSFVPEGGERPDALLARVRDFLDEIKTRHQDGNVALVTHYGVIRAIVEEILGMDRRYSDVPNAGALVIYLKGKDCYSI